MSQLLLLARNLSRTTFDRLRDFCLQRHFDFVSRSNVGLDIVAHVRWASIDLDDQFRVLAKERPSEWGQQKRPVFQIEFTQP